MNTEITNDKLRFCKVAQIFDEANENYLYFTNKGEIYKGTVPLCAPKFNSIPDGVSVPEDPKIGDFCVFSDPQHQDFKVVSYDGSTWIQLTPDMSEYVNLLNELEAKLDSSVSMLESEMDAGFESLDQKIDSTSTEIHDYIDGRLEHFDDVLHFKGVVSELPDTAENGDVYLIGGVIDSSGSNLLCNGQEYVYVKPESSESGFWEVMGDQTTYATKGYVNATFATIDTMNGVQSELDEAELQIESVQSQLDEYIEQTDNTISEIQESLGEPMDDRIQGIVDSTLANIDEIDFNSIEAKELEADKITAEQVILKDGDEETDVKEELDQKVSKSGDTMTGKLVVQAEHDTDTGFLAKRNKSHWTDYKVGQINVSSSVGTRILTFPDHGGTIALSEDVLATNTELASKRNILDNAEYTRRIKQSSWKYGSAVIGYTGKDGGVYVWQTEVDDVLVRISYNPQSSNSNLDFKKVGVSPIGFDTIATGLDPESLDESVNNLGGPFTFGEHTFEFVPTAITEGYESTGRRYATGVVKYGDNQQPVYAGDDGLITLPEYTATDVGVSMAAGDQNVALAVGASYAFVPTFEFMTRLWSTALPKSDVIKQSDVTFDTPAGKAADAKDLKTQLDGKADEYGPSFSRVTYNGVDYTEWTTLVDGPMIVLQVNVGGTPRYVAQFNQSTGIFARDFGSSLFDGEPGVAGVSPTLRNKVARKGDVTGLASALSGKLDKSGGTATDLSVVEPLTIEASTGGNRATLSVGTIDGVLYISGVSDLNVDSATRTLNEIDSKLNELDDEKLDKSGGTMTGTLNIYGNEDEDLFFNAMLGGDHGGYSTKYGFGKIVQNFPGGGTLQIPQGSGTFAIDSDFSPDSPSGYVTEFVNDSSLLEGRINALIDAKLGDIANLLDQINEGDF